MSANTPAAAPAKSKKMLVIIIGVVVAVLVLGGGAAAWLVASRSHADEEEDAAPTRKETPKVAPTFLPMENMVVNLADPGGDRFAQIGITLELDDAKTAEQVKLYLPSIRSGVLLLVSQRTSDELLQREVVMELQRRRIKIAALLESRRRFELWQGVLMKEIAFKESRLSVSGDEYLEQRKDIRKMYADLDNEASKNAEVEAALIMEYGWLK